jgi:hypothetical protein
MHERLALRRAFCRLVAIGAAMVVLASVAISMPERATAASYDWHFRPPGVTVYFNRSETRWIAGGSRLSGFQAAANFLSAPAAAKLFAYARAYANYLYYYRGQCLWISADVTKSFNYGGWRC